MRERERERGRGREQKGGREGERERERERENVCEQVSLSCTYINVLPTLVTQGDFGPEPWYEHNFDVIVKKSPRR